MVLGRLMRVVRATRRRWGGLIHMFLGGTVMFGSMVLFILIEEELTPPDVVLMTLVSGLLVMVLGLWEEIDRLAELFEACKCYVDSHEKDHRS